jgi:Acyl-coenzyme A:6-aminopenicillanic acid acyl-transferase
MSIDEVAPLATIDISGGPYDVGVKLGRISAQVVNTYLTKSQSWAGIIAYSDDPRVVRMSEQVCALFPRYWEELCGLADGLELPFGEVFAWNCRGDIRALAPDGCTTVQIPGPRRIIAHNEDGDPGFRGHCTLAHISSDGGTPFTAFVYPGSLPGHTFAETQAGLVQTVNNIRSINTGLGLPRMVLTRAVLDCQSLDDALSLLQSFPRAGAFHLTLAMAGDPRLLSVEFGSETCSVHEIVAPSIHANHFIHPATKELGQIVTNSSASRQNRGNILMQDWCEGQNPLMILRDRADPELPILRDDPEDPDHENTLASAVFFVEDGQIDWYVYDRASTAAQFHFRKDLINGSKWRKGRERCTTHD